MIIVKKIKPMFTGLITTMNMLEEKDMLTKGGLIDVRKQARTVNEYQTVIAVGPHVQNIKVGDLVRINPTRFGKPYQKQKSISSATEEYEAVMSYQFDTVEVDGKICLKLQDRDIDYVVEEYEEFDENPTIVVEEPPKLII